MRERHGHATDGLSPTYMSWKAMKARCYNPKDKRYHRYGGRGITICASWRKSFSSFLADMGDRPAGCTLDRIDLDGNYIPHNCRWADRITQARNSINARLLTFQGRTQTVAAWTQELGVKKGLIDSRINKLGWSVERALSTPTNNWSRRGS